MALKNICTVNYSRRSPEVEFGDAVYYPEGECGPRTQRYFQLVVMHTGESHVSLADTDFTIPTGSVALMFPGCREHSYFSRHQRTHHTWCSVYPENVPKKLHNRLHRLPRVQPQSITLDHIMKAAFAVRGWRRDESQKMLTYLGFAALHEYVRIVEVGPEETHRDSPSERARNYLEEHYAAHDALKGAAQTAGITPQHLIRLFHQHYKTTPDRYLWQLRIEQATCMLATSGLTIAEIAYRGGFSNPFHFSLMFHKMQGVAPREFRRRAWQSRTY